MQGAGVGGWVRPGAAEKHRALHCAATFRVSGGQLLFSVSDLVIYPCYPLQVQRGCDLTSAPRKSLLRLLAEHCSDDGERRRLLLLCSRDGKEAYAKVLRGRGRLAES